MVLDTLPEDEFVQVLAYASVRELGRPLCVIAVLSVLDTASTLLFLHATRRYLQLAYSSRRSRNRHGPEAAWTTLLV